MTATVNLGLSTPPQGSNVDTWSSDPINNNSGIIDSKFGVVSAIALTNAPVTLNTAQYQSAVIRFSGILTGNVLVTLPAVSLAYTFENRCTGNFYVAVTCGSSFQIGLPQDVGNSVDIFTDGAFCIYRNLPMVGSYLDYAGTAVPPWVSGCTIAPYLACDGSTFNATTYPRLNTLLGGNTLPDFRGRSRSYLNGGTGRITTAGSGIDGDTRLSAGGAQSVTLDVTMIPSITPAGVNTKPTITVSGGTIGGTSSLGNTNGAGSSVPLNPSSIVASLDNAPVFSGTPFGGGLAHTNMPPTAIGGVTLIRAG